LTSRTIAFTFKCQESVLEPIEIKAENKNKRKETKERRRDKGKKSERKQRKKKVRNRKEGKGEKEQRSCNRLLPVPSTSVPLSRPVFEEFRNIACAYFLYQSPTLAFCSGHEGSTVRLK
jgi:hypothetical protein